MPDTPVIRNLGILKADMVDALRDILTELYLHKAGKDTERLTMVVDTKTRRVLELLTGSRE